MNFNQFSDVFRKKALQATYSEEEIIKCLNYAKPLVENNLPVIFNTTHFAALIGYRKVYVKKAALYTHYYYRSFIISKRNGKPRTIAEPLPSLKEIQQWVLANILENMPVSKFAKAYLPKRDIRDNAKHHINKPMVLTMDVKDFFSSIKREAVERIFRAHHYSPKISNLLSKLCTLNGSLPQGASTSPYLSNLYLNEFDEVVAKYAIKKKIRYTRYADDLCFSGDFDAEELVEYLKYVIKDYSLEFNETKTKLMRRNNQQMVTGIVVNEKMQVSKRERQNIRLEIFYIKKYGLKSHLENSDPQNKKSNYLLHLLGRINYLLQLNPNDSEFHDYKIFIKSTFFSTNILL